MTDKRYDFVQLGEDLATHLIRAAEEQVIKAQAILDQTKSMAEILRNQVHAQAKQIEDTNVRFKAFGEQMLDAHRRLADEGHVIGQQLRPPASLSSLAGRGSPAGDGAGRANPAGIGPIPSVDPRRNKDRSARQDGGLPNALADLDSFKLRTRADPGTDHINPPGDGDGRPF